MAITVYEREICDSDGKSTSKQGCLQNSNLKTSDLRPQVSDLKSSYLEKSHPSKTPMQTQNPSSNHRTCNLRSYGELSDNFDEYRISVYCIAKIKQNMEGMRLTT